MPKKEKIYLECVSQRIKILRTKKKYTQRELAEMMNKAESTVRMWELGKSEPDNDSLMKLAELLGSSSDYLLGRTETPTCASVNKIVLMGRDGMTDEYDLTEEDADKIKKMIDMFEIGRKTGR